MTREEWEMLSDEQKFDLFNNMEDLQQYADADDSVYHRLVKCKCKPTYNFQSIEFEWDLDIDDDTEDNKQQMFELYGAMVDYLMSIAPEQPTNVVRKASTVKTAKNTQKAMKADAPATAKQIEILKMYHIPYTKGITVKEAIELITASIKKKNNNKED